jgi:hypothetical protein
MGTEHRAPSTPRAGADAWTNGGGVILHKTYAAAHNDVRNGGRALLVVAMSLLVVAVARKSKYYLVRSDALALSTLGKLSRRRS